MQKDKNHQYDAILEILLMNPRIADSWILDSIMAKTDCSVSKMKFHVKKYADKTLFQNDPLKYAKLGKLLLWAGDTLRAETYLVKAINILPNLIEPRYNLSIIEKRKNNVALCELYESQYNVLMRVKNQKEFQSHIICIDEIYYKNFRNWYGGAIPPSYLIFE